MTKRTIFYTTAMVAALTAFSAAKADDIVFNNTNDNGYFTPFTSSTPSSVRYGDGGWLSNFQPGGFTLSEIDLSLAVFNGSTAGTTDLTFTFNDGDPSGLVFGPGTTLYSTTISNVSLPASPANTVNYLTVAIPLPNVLTSGGFNNIGWSVGVSNFQYNGQMGFQCSSANGQLAGFYTNNASFYNGSSWSLFAFSGDPTFGVANFVAKVHAVPEPTTLSLLAFGTLALIRRRR